LNPAGEQISFFENQYFLLTCFFLIQSSLITLLLGIPSMHQNGTWVKLNVHHLGTRIC